MSLIMRIDLFSTHRGSGSHFFLLIWQLMVYKGRDRAATHISFTSFLLIPFFSLCLGFCLSGYCGFVFLSFCLVSLCATMSRGSLLGKESVEKSLSNVVTKLRIKIPRFDNSELIKGYAKTVIGRCMNPRFQDMKVLLFMLPRIWQVEGRVAGADLGLGRFQFDFDEEEDINEVLKMEPFHFDGWMVSLVRWKPTVDPSYPSSLTFWVRVLGIPIEYWADPTFRTIGKALGKVVAVDIDVGRVQVMLDGFKPLRFETTIEFDSGEETTVSLRYERLYSYCNFCFSMCHRVDHCEKKHGIQKPVFHPLVSEDGTGAHLSSYKGDVVQDKQSQYGKEGKGKGIAVEKDRTDERMIPRNSQANGQGKDHQSRFLQGEGSSRHKRFTSYAQYNDHRALKARMKEVTKVKAVVSTEVNAVPPEAVKPKKLVHKSLVFEVEANQNSELLVEQEEQVVAENQGKGVEVRAPSDHVPNQSALEEGELNLLTTAAVSAAVSPADMGIAEGENVEDTVMKDSDQFMLGSFSVELPEALWDQTYGNFLLQENETLATLDAILEGDAVGINGISEMCTMGSEAELDEIVESDKGKESQIGKKKNGKGAMLLTGVNSRKRNVQVLVTPRKRTAPKDGASTGDGVNPKNQDKEKGNPGGTKLPKPSA